MPAPAVFSLVHLRSPCVYCIVGDASVLRFRLEPILADEASFKEKVAHTFEEDVDCPHDPFTHVCVPS